MTGFPLLMDPASSPLGKMLLEEITPVVMVLATPLVEEACLKNGLSFIEMLSPFCNFSNIDVPVRTSSDQTYRIHKFKLRLFYESDIRQPNLEVFWLFLQRMNSLSTNLLTFSTLISCPLFLMMVLWTQRF